MDQIGRRRFLTTLGAAALANSLGSFAQRTSKVPRIGILTPYADGSCPDQIRRGWIHESLTRFGYTVGTDITIEWRHWPGQRAHLSMLVKDLIEQNVNVIVAWVTGDTRATAEATKVIPIVMVSYSTDPVEDGVVSSLAHPAGNVTGIKWVADFFDIIVKQYVLLKLAVPTAGRTAALWKPWTTNESDSFQFVLKVHRRIEAALGMAVTGFVLRSPEDVAPTLDRIEKFRPDALFVGTTEFRITEITAFAVKHKLVM